MELIRVNIPEEHKNYYRDESLDNDDFYGYGQTKSDKFNNVKYVVFWYGVGGYDGDGELVFVLNDGRISQPYNLCHCSCFGPSDLIVNFDESKECWRTLTDILNSENVLDNSPCDEILNKLKELVS